MAKIMPQITTSATSTADVPTQKFAGVDAADASKIVVVTSDPTSGDTFDYADPSVIAGGRWQDGDSATQVVLETSTDTVGIGTDNPGAPLHVYKAAASADHTPMEFLRLEQQDEGVDMSAGHGPAITFYVGETGGSDHGGSVAVVREIEGDADSAAAMTFATAVDDGAPIEKMRISSAGNVGVGTITPAVDLDIEDTTTSSATQGGNLRLGSNDGAVMAASHRLGVVEFAGAEDTGGTMTVGARIESVADATWSASENGANMDFYTTDGDATQTKQMSILNGTAGNVTLGGDRDLMYGALTTSKKLTVYGTADRSVLELGSSKAANGEPMGAVHFINNDNADSTNFDVDSKVIGLMQMETVTSDSNAGDDSGGNFTLSTKPEAGTIAARLTVLSAGDVGIGVSDPDTKLEILDAAATQLKLSFDGTDNCTLGVDTYGMLTVTPSGGTITNTAANGVINSAALRTKGAHTHPDTFIKNTHLPVHGSGISNNWLYVSAGKYSNSQLTAPSSGADAIRLIKWQPASAYSDGNTYQIILPSLDATWSSSSNYVSYKIVVQQDTAMGSWSSAVYLQLSGEGGSDTINGSASDYTFDAISGTSVSAKDRTIDVAGYYDGSKTVWEVIRVAQWS